VANHISYFDPPILGIALPRPVGYLAQVELFRTRLGSWLFHQIRCLPINRAKPDRTSIREAIRRLKQGWCLGIFPEGGIRQGENSVLGGNPILRPGAGALALLAGVPIVPTLIEGTREGYNWKKLLLLRRPIVRITFGEPFLLTKGHSRDNATEQIREQLLKLARDVKTTSPCI
jgi:1-acyl-sn-glycerol-3-phosphate acyltransferase